MVNAKDRAIVSTLARQYLDLLKKNNIDIIGAYLFGSYVKGNATVWSDIDIALITKEFVGDDLDFRFLLTKIGHNIDIDIEPHPFLINEFNEDNPLAAEILRNGERIV
ncbi:MAG: nucleotidyltransferase domain-containing protein [Nitrospirae bacterium]|nr:nucleotidyltransferase domain-containing protein [Nitrospirota bacterium]MBF0540997.1 nucleotidyltransferase domain-containing protein [Nitrospirota bacterium]